MTKLLAVALLLTTPALALAGPASYFDNPDTIYATNTVIDIIEHHGGIWFATGAGLNFSLDSGKTWLLYNKDNGLPSNDVSAIYSSGDTIWVATNHTGNVSGTEVSFSDTLVFSNDNGETWQRVDFGSVPFAAGPFRTIYDITGAQGIIGHDWLFAAAFAGGLLGSSDGGATWQRVFPSRGDSVNFAKSYASPQLDTLWWRNRYFSCKADTSHPDSLFLWAGSAGGVLQYVFTLPENKFYTNGIRNIAYCQSCEGKSSDSLFMFIGGMNGVSRGLVNGGPYLTRFTSDGLPGSIVTSLYEYGGVVYIGTADSSTGVSTGLAVSKNYLQTISSTYTDASVIGPDNHIYDFVGMRDRVYLAARYGGFQVTSDSGLTWHRVYLDSASQGTGDRWNTAWSLAALGDTLFVATDAGLAMVFMNSTGAIDSTRLIQISYGAEPANRIGQVRLQLFGVDSAGVADSFHVWTLNRAVSGGHSTVGRSLDRGVTWELYEPGTIIQQLAIAGDTVYIVDTARVRLADTKLDSISFVKEDIRTGTTDSLVEPATVQAFGKYVAVGAYRTLALSIDQGKTWAINHPNFNPLTPDVVGLYTDSTTQNLDTSGIYTYGLTGNFVPALGLQYMGTGKPAQVLASCRPTNSGFDAVSLGKQVPITLVSDSVTDTIGYGYKWQVAYRYTFAWNADSPDSNTTYLATDNGLLAIRSAGTANQTVDTIEFRNAAGVRLVTPGTPVYAVKQSDSDLWVGTGDGTIRISLADLADQDLFIKIDSGEEVYAYPVPFSPNRGDQVRFHFPVTVAGNVTLEIYDFAMNLVATPVNNRHFDVGVYPPGPLPGERVSWNGRNGRGDLAAVGIYYIKLTYGDGSIKWGKLAIVP